MQTCKEASSVDKVKRHYFGFNDHGSYWKGIEFRMLHGFYRDKGPVCQWTKSVLLKMKPISLQQVIAILDVLSELGAYYTRNIE